MKLVSNGEILDFFRRRIENLTGNSAKEYNKVFTSLSSFVPADTSTLSSPAKSIIEDWCVYLINGGLTKKTVTHYIDIVSGLYSSAVNEGLVGPTDVFKTLKASVKYADAFKPIVSISEADYGRLRNLVCVSHRLPNDIGLFVDIFIVSLLTGCKSLMEVAMLKRMTFSAIHHRWFPSWSGIAKVTEDTYSPCPSRHGLPDSLRIMLPQE